jgi:hypothetical protein
VDYFEPRSASRQLIGQDARPVGRIVVYNYQSVTMEQNGGGQMGQVFTLVEGWNNDRDLLRTHNRDKSSSCDWPVERFA